MHVLLHEWELSMAGSCMHGQVVAMAGHDHGVQPCYDDCQLLRLLATVTIDGGGVWWVVLWRRGACDVAE